MGDDGFKVEAVIFDLDGTLIDSMNVYYSIMRIVFEELDFPPISREEMWGAVKENGFEWASVLPKEVLPRQEEVIAKARGIIDEVSPLLFRTEVRPIPGAVEVLRDFSRVGMRIGLVTSTPSRHLDVKLAALGTAGAHLFDGIVTADDTPQRKPAADPLLEGSRRLGVIPAKSVYTGDSRVDIISGKAAGMKTVGVLTGMENYESLMREDPDAILPSVAELGGVIHL